MHPAINREVSNTRVADFHRQARRDAMSRAAADTLRSRKGTVQSARGYRVATQVARRFLAIIAPAKRTTLLIGTGPRHSAHVVLSRADQQAVEASRSNSSSIAP